MPWVILAFVNTALDGAGNILDGHMSNRYFRNPWTLLFFFGILDVFLLPILFLFRLPQAIGLSQLALFMLIGALNATVLALYYLALQEDDTSIVSSLFSLGKVTVPVFAFFIVGERLHLSQYIAFMVVVVCSSALAMHTLKGKVTISKAFVLMLGASLMNSLIGVLYKFSLERVDWVTSFTYVTIFSAGSVFVISLFRVKAIRTHWVTAKQHARTLIAISLMGWVASLCGTAALSVASVTVVKGIFATQPLFVIAYTWMFQRRWPHLFKENMTRGHILKKGILFAIIILTLVFIVRE